MNPSEPASIPAVYQPDRAVIVRMLIADAREPRPPMLWSIWATEWVYGVDRSAEGARAVLPMCRNDQQRKACEAAIRLAEGRPPDELPSPDPSGNAFRWRAMHWNNERMLLSKLSDMCQRFSLARYAGPDLVTSEFALAARMLAMVQG
ncbi:hypothetical protein [Roseiflexus castenholzii]|uniref:hypothetical protein n=1 Tax=Roseiflexus castenholzii TaxID=120962 RepID=UPI003C7DCB97